MHKVTSKTEDHAKELFNRSARVAVNTCRCVSCKGKAWKMNFTTPESYAEYKEDGLCQTCVDELK